jgi:hypothetical protein
MIRVSFCAAILWVGMVGSAFAAGHQVMSVEGPGAVRVRYFGAPVVIKLANIGFKGDQNQVNALRYLKDTLKPGSDVAVVLEPELNGNDVTVPVGQIFLDATHINLEMVKRGIAVFNNPKTKYAADFEAAQTDAKNAKIGVWAGDAPAAIVTDLPPAPLDATNVSARAETASRPIPPPVIDLAPADYTGPVVADLNGKEYFFPMSRYAQNIRDGARIEYKNPADAERAGKAPSPFSFPERAREYAAKIAQSKGGATPAETVAAARKAYGEAQSYMKEARAQSRSTPELAGPTWKKAAILIAKHLDNVMPISDSNPSDVELQKLTEEMSMSLYACNKYMSL